MLPPVNRQGSDPTCQSTRFFLPSGRSPQRGWGDSLQVPDQSAFEVVQFNTTLIEAQKAARSRNGPARDTQHVDHSYLRRQLYTTCLQCGIDRHGSDHLRNQQIPAHIPNLGVFQSGQRNKHRTRTATKSDISPRKMKEPMLLRHLSRLKKGQIGKQRLSV